MSSILLRACALIAWAAVRNACPTDSKVRATTQTRKEINSTPTSPRPCVVPRALAVVFALLLITAITATWPAPILAEQGRGLDVIVVTPLGEEESSEKLPANVTVITEEDIRNSTASNVGELIRDHTGIIVRDFYGTGTKTTIDMRGFARGLNTAVLVNNRRVNEIDLSGVDWNLIPLDNIERIEVVRGGGSVLYGDNATSGVINIITKKGSAKRPRLVVELRSEGFEGEGEAITINNATEAATFNLTAKKRSTEGYRDNGYFDSEDLNTRLTFTPNLSTRIDLSGAIHEDTQGLPGGLTEAELRADREQTTTPDDNVTNDHAYYDAVIEYALSGALTLEVEYSNSVREFDAAYSGASYTYDAIRETDTDELKVKFTSRQPMFGRKNLLTAGFDRYDSSVVNDSIFVGAFSTTTTASGIEKEEKGSYLANEFFISPALTFTAGYRYSRTVFKDSVYSDDSFFGITIGSGFQRFKEEAVNAGLTFNHVKGGKLYASFSKGFRLPTTDELFSFDGTIVRLKPELTETVEVGMVHPLGSAATISLTLYEMDVENELYWNPPVLPFFFGANENLDETLHRGAELALSGSLGEALSFDGNWTFTEATFESGAFDGNDIPLVPVQSAAAFMKLRLSTNSTLSLSANWVGERYLDSDVDNSLKRLDEYTTVDARLTIIDKRYTLYLGAKNIFDEEYSEYGVEGSTENNFYPSPDRWYYAGIKYAY